ncbi:ESX secretion-associated protein EspG [Nocardia asteroides]|uniref:ESX secretion-associated protein EspG n=1 Tax=Nocardia asteroides TaxID=1824 RepID=UPI001E57EBC1|nr:ESX secretion-associated protein EspG [Nocardia asteroides]UGT60569.1 ESX secretion-associated protein EspG [Nocardia asteroides]
MIRRWEFSDLEFKVLCEDVRPGEIPDPFTYTSTIRSAAALETATAGVLRDFRDRYDPDLEDLADALSKPDVAVTAEAWNDRDIENPKEWIRVLGLRRRARGFVIRQHPGETVLHSAGFDVVECDPHALADRVLALLPVTESGRDTPIPILDPAVRNPGGETAYSSMISDNDDPDDRDSARSAAFFAIPASASGLLRVLQGRSKFGPRGRVETAMLWRDVPGDGRYVMPMSSSPVARGMGTEELVVWVDEHIAEIVDRLERHREDEE